MVSTGCYRCNVIEFEEVEKFCGEVCFCCELYMHDDCVSLDGITPDRSLYLYKANVSYVLSLKSLEPKNSFYRDPLKSPSHNERKVNC